jgi:hypothetical protein
MYAYNFTTANIKMNMYIYLYELMGIEIYILNLLFIINIIY